MRPTERPRGLEKDGGGATDGDLSMSMCATPLISTGRRRRRCSTPPSWPWNPWDRPNRRRPFSSLVPIFSLRRSPHSFLPHFRLLCGRRRPLLRHHPAPRGRAALSLAAGALVVITLSLSLSLSSVQGESESAPQRRLLSSARLSTVPKKGGLEFLPNMYPPDGDGLILPSSSLEVDTAPPPHLNSAHPLSFRTSSSSSSTWQ